MYKRQIDDIENIKQKEIYGSGNMRSLFFY